ncbi:MAG: hypothetical protein Q8933_12995 [Bacteroidota bacterium]|nr:hypothetical protein [Bacteroidota bacterium]MDP4196783.1 hypothetical protein [Bacteroidota bacterium]
MDNKNKALFIILSIIHKLVEKQYTDFNTSLRKYTDFDTPLRKYVGHLSVAESIIL